MQDKINSFLNKFTEVTKSPEVAREERERKEAAHKNKELNDSEIRTMFQDLSAKGFPYAQIPAAIGITPERMNKALMHRTELVKKTKIVKGKEKLSMASRQEFIRLYCETTQPIAEIASSLGINTYETNKLVESLPKDKRRKRGFSKAFPKQREQEVVDIIKNNTSLSQAEIAAIAGTAVSTIRLTAKRLGIKGVRAYKSKYLAANKKVALDEAFAPGANYMDVAKKYNMPHQTLYGWLSGDKRYLSWRVQRISGGSVTTHEASLKEVEPQEVNQSLRGYPPSKTADPIPNNKAEIDDLKSKLLQVEKERDRYKAALSAFIDRD